MNDSDSAAAGKYAGYSPEQLIAEINRLKKNKKYGLVWEHKKENVIENFETQQPYLEEATDKRIEDAPDEPTNLIIEGDNFEALSILNYTHAGKVDVIYIDPPYNTGNKDFIYNDNYVDAEDEFRHSKWLSFMEPRLKLSKNLLKDDGVIFISIDDNEYSDLKLLCDEIFNNQLITDLIWNTKNASKGVPPLRMVTSIHEHILVYSNVGSTFKFNGIRRTTDDFSNPDNDPRGLWRKEALVSTISKRTFEIIDPKTGNKFNRAWAFSQDTLEEMIKDGRVIFPKKENGTPLQKKFFTDYTNDGLPIVTQLGTYQSRKATSDLMGMFNGQKVFDFPKPVDLIKFIINQSTNSASCVLDFFAGSGTTGQAVLELNEEDGGHRQFILCTNNGDKGPDSTKIAEEITYPRIKTVITGKRQDGSKYSDGIPANLRYYKINHREKKPSIDANRQDFAPYMEDILQVKENAYKQLEVNEDFALYDAKDKYVGIVLEPFALEEIIEKIKQQNTDKRPVKMYVFSYSRDALEDEYDADFEISFAAMPEGILKTYANIVAEIKKEDA